MNPKEILIMAPGPALDRLVTESMREIAREIQGKAWSMDPMAMLELREFITFVGVDVHITKYSESPGMNAEQVFLIESEEDEETGNLVSVAFESLPEAMAKAFLLYLNREYGHYTGSKWEAAAATENQRTAKIYPFPIKHN